MRRNAPASLMGRGAARMSLSNWAKGASMPRGKKVGAEFALTDDYARNLRVYGDEYIASRVMHHVRHPIRILARRCPSGRRRGQDDDIVVAFAADANDFRAILRLF